MTAPTRAEIDAFIAKAEADDAAAAEQLARLKIDIEAGQRRHDAYKLVPGFADSELRAVVESALAELPTEPLDDAALAKLKHRHEAQHLVKKIAELSDTDSRVDTIELRLAAVERSLKATALLSARKKEASDVPGYGR